MLMNTEKVLLIHNEGGYLSIRKFLRKLSNVKLIVRIKHEN